MSGVEYRRTLPHFQPEGTAIFITWRLFGSIPVARRKLLVSDPTPGRIFAADDSLLDRAPGPRYLAETRIALIVANYIREGAHRRFYGLHAWVIMPNHIHLLITPNVSVRRITQGLKGATARRANQILGRTGMPFWLDEPWDRWLRSDEEFGETVRYIECNPVTAGLADRPEAWPWSSAAAKG